jgi:sugar phosphate isomerase/epimerase
MFPTAADRLTRRAFLHAGAAGVAGLLLPAVHAQPEEKKPTKFQIACMTLPYAAFPLDRAMKGLQSAGYKHIALGHTHTDADGKRVSVLPGDAPLDRAKDLGKKCRDLGMEPVLMFGPGPESVEGLKTRIKHAQAAGIAQILTMGNTKGNDIKLWVKNFKELAPMARENGVTIVVKQHGGNTGTGEVCGQISREVNDEGVKVSYDAGNVLDYYNAKIDPIADIAKCAGEVRGFCIKDHRNFPRASDKGQDCGPGFGEIDHWKLLQPVAFTGRTIPLCCENIFAPFVPRPKDPAELGALARRAREFLEVVIAGLQG